MSTAYRTISNAYQDSVKLMRVSREVGDQRDVAETVAVMGTEENKDRLIDSGLATAAELEDIGPNDLILAAADEDAELASQAVDEMESELRGQSGPRQPQDGQKEQPARSIAAAVDRLPSASVALISIPGAYATREAWKALHEGLDVHLFSDNVPIEDERALKTAGRERDQLVMGPDCGTAIINGVPLGFANDVNEGAIGVVAAAGTGLQEVTSLIDRAGAGISQAIGTGGRDLQDAIGGITMRQGLSQLASDDETDVIVLISKPPEAETMAAVLEDVTDCPKPVVIHFIGGDRDQIEQAGGIPASTLADAAVSAVREQRRMADQPEASVDVRAGVDSFVSPDDAANLVEQRADTERSIVRGLFTGGTLSAEAALILEEHVEEIHSNVGIGSSLADPLEPTGNAIVDLGTDELTRGRPHPMIDPSIRSEQLEAVMAADDVLVVLLDLVLGYGAVDDPAESVVEAIPDTDADWPLVIASVCGTPGDPQGWERQIERLHDAGVAVCSSNAAAARLAADIHATVGGNGGENR